MAAPKIAAMRHRIQTLGNVLLNMMITADCISISNDNDVSNILPVISGKSAKQKIIISREMGITKKYPRIMSFRSTMSMPHRRLVMKSKM